MTTTYDQRPRRVEFTRAAQAELGTLAPRARRRRSARQITKRDAANAAPPDNQARHRQITHGLPAVSEYSEPSDVETLARIVRDARRARDKRHTLRKPSAPARIGHADRWERTQLHLKRLARRALNDLAKLGHPVPSPDALAEALAAYVWAECSHMVHEQAPGEARLSSRERTPILAGAEAVERVSGNAARYALRTWTPDYIAEMQRRGAVGGQRSRRGATYTPEDLDALAALMAAEPHLTTHALAERTGRGVRTVERMRRALRERLETP